MNSILVSVIVPTKNSSRFLEACLKSIKNQTYKSIELIVSDNDSTDTTKGIAIKYADKVLNLGKEGDQRSAQRNFGVANANGEFIAIIDSDMELTPKVIEQCVKRIQEDETIKGIIIPEESFGEGFWAQCKALERSFYVGVDWMEAARFFRKSDYQKVGGYNENLISGEDWDLSQRITELGRLERIPAFILHNEGKLSLWNLLRKKFHYARHFAKYIDNKHQSKYIKKQTNVVARYTLFLSKPSKLTKNPLIGLGMLFMKTCELGFGAIGYLTASSTRGDDKRTDLAWQK